MKHYTVHDGLAQMQLTCIFQDSRGYLWLGTGYGGVSKFNGDKFVNYTKRDGLLSNYVWKIAEDNDGNIWFGQSEGLVKFDGGSFTAFPFEKRVYDIRNLVITKDNEIYFSVNEIPKVRTFRAGKYIPIKGNFNVDLLYHKDLDKVLIAQHYKGIYEVKDTSVFPFLEDTTTIHRIDYSSQFHEYTYHTRNDSTKVYSAYLFRKDTMLPLWTDDLKNVNYENLPKTGHLFTRGNMLLKMNPFTEKIDSTLAFPYNGLRIYRDKDNTTWLASENGLYRLNPESFANYRGEAFRGIWSIVEESDNKYWFASYRKKLYQFNGKKAKKEKSHYFSEYHKNTFYMGGLKDKNGNVLFPMGASCILKSNGEQFDTIYIKGSGGHLYLHEDTSRNFIISGRKKGISFMQNYKEICYKGVEDGMHENKYIISICKDKNEHYWLGSYTGLSRYDYDEDIIYNYTKENGKLTGNGVISSFKDYKGGMWFGTTEGIMRYDYGTDSLYQVAAEIITRYGNAITSIDSTHLLFASQDGLYILFLENYYRDGSIKLKHFNNKNGFSGVEPDQNTLMKDSKGHIWIPTFSHLVKLIPEKLDLSIPEVNAVITELNNERTAFNADTIQLDYGQNEIKFRFEGVGFETPLKNLFSYRLKGYKDKWSPWEEEDFAVFSGLGSGVYTFEVKTKNGSLGNENSRLDQVKVVIALPFWEETNFPIYAMIGFSLLGGLVFFYFLRARNSRLKTEKTIQKNQYLQVQTLQSQMNPHFVFNVLGTLQNRILSTDRIKANDQLVMLSKLIRRFLDASVLSDKQKEETFKHEITLEKELELLFMYIEFEQIQYKDRFTYQLEWNEHINASAYTLPPMIIQPYIENAIKHGILKKDDSGKLTVNFTLTEEEALVCVVEDDGIGRIKASALQRSSLNMYQSHGTNLVKRRIKLLNEMGYNITVRTIDKPNHTGTKVIIKIDRIYAN